MNPLKKQNHSPKSNQKALWAKGLSVSLLAFLIGGCAVAEKKSDGIARSEQQKAMGQATESAVQARKNDDQQLGKEIAKAIALRPESLIPRPESKQTEKRFDIAAQLSPAATVFQAIADRSPYNLVLTEGVGAELVTVNMKDVSVKDALEAMRDAHGYEFEVSGRRILVSKPPLVTKIYQLNYLPEIRTGRSDVRVASGSISDNPSLPGAGVAGGQTGGPGGQTGALGGQTSRLQESSRVTSTASNDFWGDLDRTLRVIANGEGRQISVNAQSGTVFIKATPSEARSIESYLRKIEGAVSRQVMLEAKIIEVSLRDGAQSGINWSAFRNQPNSRASIGVISPGASLGTSGTISAPTGRLADGTIDPGGALSSLVGSALTLGSSATGLFGLAFQTSNFAALLSFLETQGETRVLSSPRIATLNSQKAVLKVGTDEYFVTNVSTTTTTSGTGSSVSTPSITTQSFFSGIALDVTPQIAPNGDVILRVHPAISEVVEKNKTINLGALGNYTLPLASSSVNETDSVVKVPNGQIVAIGGLMRVSSASSNSKVPGLGDAPVVGGIFKQTAGSAIKSELVILIKPTVIESNADWAAGLDGFGK